MSKLTRRDVLRLSAAVAGTAALARFALAEDAPPKRVLFFTKSAGFQHSVIDRHGKDGPAYAEQILIDLGEKRGLDVTVSKDGGQFTPEKLAPFDAFVFYTTGDLTQAGTDKQPPMPAGGKDALLAAVAGGKGFVGLHCATDTFHSHGDAVDPVHRHGRRRVRHPRQPADVDRPRGRRPSSPAPRRPTSPASRSGTRSTGLPPTCTSS